jgi:hypothetical protein
MSCHTDLLLSSPKILLYRRQGMTVAELMRLTRLVITESARLHLDAPALPESTPSGHRCVYSPCTSETALETFRQRSPLSNSDERFSLPLPLSPALPTSLPVLEPKGPFDRQLLAPRAFRSRRLSPPSPPRLVAPLVSPVPSVVSVPSAAPPSSASDGTRLAGQATLAQRCSARRSESFATRLDPCLALSSL